MSKKNQDSGNLLDNLRKFRFQKSTCKKLKMSDDDSNSESQDFQIRRKIVNRIEDSDSDAGTSTSASAISKKASGSDSEEMERLNKLQYLINVYPNHSTEKIQKILTDVDWDSEEANKILKRKKKRMHNGSPKGNKKKRRRRNSDDEDNDEVESDEDNYKSHKVFDSDDDSDVEISNELTTDKKSVLEFLQNGLLSEFLLMHQCSNKKAEAIIAARPFESWRDLVEKFQQNKYLDTELLNSAQSLIATRNVIKVLMKKCLRLSTNMEKAVAAGASMITEQPRSLAPDLKLTAYQMVGLNWLAVMHSQNVNGILADEMGLGKTIQVIAFLTYLKEANLLAESDGPHLIVVPSSTMENWRNELEKWSPGLNVVQYYGSQDERKEMRLGWRKGDLDDVDILLTTYNLISSTPEERRLFRVLPLTYVIFDEAHMLKNMSTMRYENLVRIHAKHRILLTGTPLQNNLLELMSLLIFVMPSIFAGKVKDLKSIFSKSPKTATDKKNDNNVPLFEQEQVKNAKLIMGPFVLRRLKSQVLKDLPPKTEEIIKCKLIDVQHELYQQMMAAFSEEADTDGVNNTVGMMMMQLRKLANHPLLIRNYYTEDKLHSLATILAKDSTYKEKNPSYIFDDLLWMSDYQINQLTKHHKSIAHEALPKKLIPESGKLKKLDELLPEMKKDNHRVLIFSQFTMVLDIVEEYMKIRDYKFLRLDGQTPVVDRQDLIDEFTEDPSIFIFLLSTRAGGLGINLTSADTVIIHDIDFNPYNDKQAEDRCHRVGQKNPVKIIRLISEGTIEEGMYEVAQEKLMLEAQITGNEEGESTNKKSLAKLLKITLGLERSSAHNKSNGSIKSPNNKSFNGCRDDFKEEEF